MPPLGPSQRRLSGTCCSRSPSACSPIALIAGNLGTDYVRVDGVTIALPGGDFLTSFRRDAAYRVYYAPVTWGTILSRGQFNALLSAEALDDG